MSGKPKYLPGTHILVPSSSSRSTYAQLIQEMSNTDTPTVFGLPANVDRSAQEIQSQALTTRLKHMTIREVSEYQSIIGFIFYSMG